MPAQSGSRWARFVEWLRGRGAATTPQYAYRPSVEEGHVFVWESPFDAGDVICSTPRPLPVGTAR